MKPVLTIGMCLHNSESTLPKAIKSICDQDFPHEKMQVIFVDDGSTDQTPKIVYKYVSKMDIQTKVFEIKWSGLGFARNLILDHADGKYILWVDADEVITPSYARKQVDFMEKNPDVGITAGTFGLVQGNFILNLELLPAIINHAVFDRPPNFLWKTRKIIGTGGTTYRTNALLRVNGFNSQFKGAGEDIDVATRVCDLGWLIKLNDGVFYEFHNGMSTITDLLKKYYWYGYGCQQLYVESRDAFSLLRMTPIPSFVAGFLFSLEAYKLFHENWFFLLPIHYGFKMIGWTCGFMCHQIKSWFLSLLS